MKKSKKIMILILPIIVLAVIVSGGIIYKLFIKPYIYPCVFHILTGYYCCGCGGTRSFYALLNGDILASLKLNPIVIFGAVTAVLKWLEMLFTVFGKRVKILPRGYIFWFSILGGFLTFYVLRNFIPFLSP